MHDGGGGVAGTEVDAEAHGEFRGDQGPRTLLQFAADCKVPQLPVPGRVKVAAYCPEKAREPGGYNGGC